LKPTEYLDKQFDGRKPRWCWMCNCQLFRSTATVDHLQLKSKGGRNVESNFKLACKPCNNARGNTSIPHRLALQLKGRLPKQPRRDYRKLAAAICRHKRALPEKD
jgi:5-methylcytosine-specific restriction endonuclease McrA